MVTHQDDDPALAPEQPRHQPAAPPRQIRVRRSPRYGGFLVTGGVLGVLVAIVSGLSGSADPAIGRGPLVGYLSIGLGLLGALLGGLVAVLLDRVRR